MAYNFNNVKILVVEDNKPMNDMVQSLLQAFGITDIVSARNGEEGYQKYVDHNPDIVIADWMMKPVDGILFTQRVRSNKNSPNPFIPIILMTGFSEKKRVITARDSGVTEFLVKPFTAKDLYKRLAQVIERPRQFVKIGDFFGPDRRRKQEDSYQGSKRRETDVEKLNKYKQATGNLKTKTNKSSTSGE